MNPAGHDLYLRLEATAEGGARVTLQREGDAPEPAADVADADPARLEARYLQPLRAFIETPVSPELLLELGRALAGLLLPDRVRARLITEAARVGAATPLRLRLTASDPWLAGLPWEFAYLEEIFPGDPGRFLGLHPRLILIRQPSAHRTIAPVEADPLRILVAWADPGSAAYPALPGLQAEVKSILAETRAPRLRGRVEVETLRSATPGALKRLLEEFSPHVLHFLGHGDAGPSGGFLVLEGDRPGAEKRLYADELARCLAGTPARLVVLSACRTGAPSAGIAQTLAEAGIGAVVGMQ
ncbi:MAG TPA: CHAT domain-containing protein, partial [Chthonomonadaceae bacterium]|nr:CHAT domain-containing protein [Chthonomonadaceae bacterium]